jgi:hypothetical protein
MFVVRSERHNFEAKEAGCPGPGMRDQRLVSRQFQSQFIAKKRADPTLDLLGL